MLHIGSATSLIACIGSILFTMTLYKINVKLNPVIIGLGVNILLILLLYGGSEIIGNVLEGLGRDSTLTGRTLIWDSLFEIIRQNALFGFGYDTFWTYNNYLRSQVAINVGGAHNGLIELVLNFGIIGTMWFLVLWINYGKQLNSLLIKKKTVMIFPFAYTILLLIYIISERTFYNSSYQTLIFVWCLIIVSKFYYTKEEN
ncbi:O-antigen ligase family protein [Terribacillus saccharophilus]|uniref:O-antigen ligase family protein n=1 Tax=Terribacillus saccharophilus TaxID=361277 RepID=UPI002DC8805C|nr:O-antigen ligase family protein [Terribacillus saccharophilus]